MSRDARFVKPRTDQGMVWNGPHMDISTPPGTHVMFHGAFPAQVDWGSGKTDPNPLLTLNAEYVLADVDIHGSYTNVRVQGFSQWFPSGAFHNMNCTGWELPQDDQ